MPFISRFCGRLSRVFLFQEDATDLHIPVIFSEALEMVIGGAREETLEELALPKCR